MYTYKFVKIKVKGSFKLTPEEDYHSIVKKHAQEGWRFVQISTPPIGFYGKSTYFELIFEKQT